MKKDEIKIIEISYYDLRNIYDDLDFLINCQKNKYLKNDLNSLLFRIGHVTNKINKVLNDKKK